eukprot:1415993-Rhodomonas_salina.6
MSYPRGFREGRSGLELGRGGDQGCVHEKHRILTAWEGGVVDLQQTTEGQSQATSMNWRGKLSVQSASERPSITARPDTVCQCRALHTTVKSMAWYWCPLRHQRQSSQRTIRPRQCTATYV